MSKAFYSTALARPLVPTGAPVASGRVRRRRPMQFTLPRMLAATFLAACACASLRWAIGGTEGVAILAIVLMFAFAAGAWGMLVAGWEGAFKAAFILLMGIFWLPLLLFSFVALIAAAISCFMWLIQ